MNTAGVIGLHHVATSTVTNFDSSDERDLGWFLSNVVSMLQNIGRVLKAEYLLLLLLFTLWAIWTAQ
jgi:hypothetical protein